MSTITELVVFVAQISKGRHGKFAVAFQEKGRKNYLIPQNESITFSLDPNCWKAENGREPEKGEGVIVESLTRHISGWRAGSARSITPDDYAQKQETERSKK